MDDQMTKKREVQEMLRKIAALDLTSVGRASPDLVEALREYRRALDAYFVATQDKGGAQ